MLVFSTGVDKRGRCLVAFRRGGSLLLSLPGILPRPAAMASFLLLMLVLQVSGFAAVELTRCSFPKGFIFGTASAAYQYEGAVNEDGRKPSIWDTISHTPGRIKDGSNGDVAEDQYHRYPEDIQLMRNMNMDAYRFSISWSRIFPNGDGINLNPAGVNHYNMLVDALLQAGIQPYITLYHRDLPQALEDRIGGWLSPKIIEKFAAYAEACFEAFGDRVKHWITFNEPLSFVGNASTGPYIAGHNVLLSHAAAVQIYRNKYQAKQKGKIGITLDSKWYQPLTNSSSDKSASRRALDFDLGWFLNPVFYGEYPQAMRVGAGSKLPMFSSEETDLLRGSIDFLGLNHYTTIYAASAKAVPPNQVSSYFQDARVTKLRPRAASEWLYIVPWGFDKLLTYIAKRYKNLIIIVTENGVSEPNDPSLPLKVALQDGVRVKYYEDYLSNLLRGMRNGANVQGYFAWSLLDNFEWTSGYTVRFGLHFVDYNDNLKRYPKHSAFWFGRMLNHTC